MSWNFTEKRTIPVRYVNGIKVDHDLNTCGHTCPKCASPNVTQRYENTGSEEFLKRRCHTCDYRWNSECKDAKP